MTPSIMWLAALYAAALLLDFYLSLSSLDGLLFTEKTACERRKVFRPLTFLGSSLSSRLEALAFKFVSEEYSLNGELKGESLGFRDPAPQSSLPKTQQELVSQILLDNSRCFRASAIALITETESSGLNVVSIGARGLRFESCLKELLRPAIGSALDESFKLTCSMSEESLVRPFASLGFRYTISGSVKVADGPFARRAILWLGYGAGQPPFASELGRAEKLGRKLSREVSEFQQLHSLCRRADEAESVSRMKSELIAHMSHDIRSPLSNVKSVLTLFKIDGIQQDSLELIDVALKNCEMLAEIVDDLLDYTRYNMGKLRAHKKTFNLALLAGEVVESFKPAAKLKGLNLEFERLGAAPFCIEADLGHLRRILSNLVSNAIKYTRHGSISVSSGKRKDGLCYVIVKDSGVGLKDEQLAKLFNPFSRFHLGLADGIGLGLSISKILTNLNGGQLTVRSKEGLGSEFEISFPIFQREDRKELLTSLRAVHTRRNAKVLVVDDDHDCSQSLARALRSTGCEVTSAVRVSDAASLINYQKPDFIITDGNMPDGGGKALLEFVHKSSHKIPVLVLTGEEESEVSFLAFGASKVMLKPAGMNEILLWMDQWGGEKAAPLAAAVA